MEKYSSILEIDSIDSSFVENTETWQDAHIRPPAPVDKERSKIGGSQGLITSEPLIFTTGSSGTFGGLTLKGKSITEPQDWHSAEDRWHNARSLPFWKFMWFPSRRTEEEDRVMDNVQGSVKRHFEVRAEGNFMRREQLNSVTKDAWSVDESNEIMTEKPSSENCVDKTLGTGGSEVLSRTLKLWKNGKIISNSEDWKVPLMTISYSPGGGQFNKMRVTGEGIVNASTEKVFG
jgi:hypothetical protein